MSLDESSDSQSDRILAAEVSVQADSRSDGGGAGRAGRFSFQSIAEDHQHFYSAESLTNLGLGLGVGAVIANSDFDEKLQDAFQENLRSDTMDEFYRTFRTSKVLGDGRYTLPLMGAAAVAGKILPEVWGTSTAGDWGTRALRATIVGTPPMLALQALTGGSRPVDHTHGSSWRPFQDDNGVSGHTFMGAVPFLAAARMAEAPWIKASFYAGSTLAGLSRLNDGSHYFSQAALGWWIAWLATEAVSESNGAPRSWSITPWVTPQGQGAALIWQF